MIYCLVFVFLLIFEGLRVKCHRVLLIQSSERSKCPFKEIERAGHQIQFIIKIRGNKFLIYFYIKYYSINIHA